MAVLVEAKSLICRVPRIFMSWDRFVALVPNRTLCCDNELARVGFMNPDDVQSFVEQLGTAGLVHISGGEAVDLSVVDQQRGPTSRTDWLDFGRSPLDDGTVCAARAKGSKVKQLYTPDGWTFEGYLSQTFGFVPSRPSVRAEIAERADGSDEIRLPRLGIKGFAGRPFRK